MKSIKKSDNNNLVPAQPKTKVPGMPENNKPLGVYDAGESVKDMPVKKVEESHKKCTPGEFGMHKEGSAFAFGAKIAERVDMPFTREGYNQVAAGSAGGTLGLLGGGAAGLGLGALHGLMRPGHVVGRGPDGQPIVKKRNRIMGALRGGLAGGVGGAMGGMALGMGGGALAEKLRPGTLGQIAPDLQKRITEMYDFGTAPKYNDT